MTGLINKNSSIPLYYQVKELIKEEIKSGEWKEGDKIPNELSLVEKFNVSRSTVRQAILELVNEGFLYRIRGQGSFVKKLKHEGNFLTFSYPEELGNKHEVISAEVIDGELDYLYALKLYNSKKVNEIIRLRYFKGEPAIIERTYLPFYLFPDILSKNMKVSIYDTILSEYKVNIARHKVHVEPILLDSYDSNLLETEEGQPALKTIKICKSSNDLPIMLSVSVFRKDRCKFLFTNEYT